MVSVAARVGAAQCLDRPLAHHACVDVQDALAQVVRRRWSARRNVRVAYECWCCVGLGPALGP
eukprot:8999190-Alexandrium_andersonii.AAC.1